MTCEIVREMKKRVPVVRTLPNKEVSWGDYCKAVNMKDKVYVNEVG